MKIGVSSYSFSKYIIKNKCNYFDICDLAKKIGFDGIEFINLDFSEWKLTDDPVKTAKEIKEYCKGLELDIPAYTVSADFLAKGEAEVERICRCVDVAKELGAPVLRHDICWSLKKDNPLYTYKDAIKEVAPLVRKVTEYAESLGIKTCTENHGHIFQAPERIEELIIEVNHPNFGWLCDMGNFLCADVDPVKGCTFAAKYAFHCHAKDMLFKSGDSKKPDGFFETLGKNYLRGTVVGHGVVPVSQCVNILKSAGYDGYFSIEFEGMEETIPALESGFKFLKRII